MAKRPRRDWHLIIPAIPNPCDREAGCAAPRSAAVPYSSLADKHSLRSIVDRMLVVVHASANKMAATLGPEVTCCRGYREALIESSVVTNAALAAYTIQQEIGSADPRALRATYGVYLLPTRQVWAPRSGGAECAGLADPPADRAAFGEFATAIARSERIARLLEHGVE